MTAPAKATPQAKLTSGDAKNIARLHWLLSNQDLQREAAQIIAAAGGIPFQGATSPLHALMLHLNNTAPEAAAQFFEGACQLHEQRCGQPPAIARQYAETIIARQPDGYDWRKEFPPREVFDLWETLPPHERVKANARSPVSEAIASREMRKLGWRPLPGLTPGETMCAYLRYAGRHSEALKKGGDEAYESLARFLGGALGDGETTRQNVESVAAIADEDDFAQKVAERMEGREAERAKYKAQPATKNPEYDPQHIPAGAIQPKERVPDSASVREVVAHQVRRQQVGGNLNGKRPPRRSYVSNSDRLDVELAYRQHSGEGVAGLELSPELRKRLVAEERALGYEPALSAPEVESRDSGPTWVPSPAGTGSVGTATSGTEGGSGRNGAA